MGLTQKYKQQQQQVRVHTNESNYLKGMYFSDVPLAEGYSRVLMNFDIDSLSGKLTPRKGLKSLGVIKPAEDSVQYLNNSVGYNNIMASRICSASDSKDPRKINRLLQSVLYNTDTRSLAIATCDPEPTDNSEFNVIPFTLNSEDEYVAPEPYVIDKPGIHGVVCSNNNFFKRPVGTFAFSNSYYTFLRQDKFIVKKIAELPNKDYKNNDLEPISSYNDLKYNSLYNTSAHGGNQPGEYYLFVEGESKGVIAYYTNAGILERWDRSEEALRNEVFRSPFAKHILCYTKLGQEIQPDEILLDSDVNPKELTPDVYYTCRVQPQRLNPSEAASWGYNMLADDPYGFKCEKTAINNVFILGIVPYDENGELPVLTPRKNQKIILKGYYRAPEQYHTDAENAKYYATTHQDDLEKATDIPSDLTDYNYGDWWYAKDTQKYYMVVTSTKGKIIDESETKPDASVKLSPTNTTDADPIRVRWQIRHSGSSDWIDIYNEVFPFRTAKVKDANGTEREMLGYYDTHGDLAPFTVTTQLPADEVLVKLTISDPDPDVMVGGEELVLATNTIGMSLVSDELANTLNLEATKEPFKLGQATGMCEWEQRLVLWGVPGALNTIFISDVNNPTFFPYPNNVDIFTDPIIAVHNYGNELLVLTTSALYRLTWDTEGTGWTHTLVQQNLHVTEADTYMSCVIKNMFFFKSGEYYYMMVPKSTAGVRGEVAIAPISKPIAELLDNFHEEVYNLIKVMVDRPNIEDFTKYLVNYFSYVDNTKVVVNYVYDLNATLGNVESVTDSKYLFVQLIYDTDTRTWSMRAFEAPHMLHASHADAIQQDRFMDTTPALDGSQFVLQYYKLEGLSDNAIQYITNIGTAQMSTKLIKNYQYLDTGNREINTELKKRFREFQFKIKNNNATNLGFHTSFLIDGSLRKDLQQYSPRFITDPSTGEGTIVVERTLDTATMTYNTTRVERIMIPERMLQDAGELTPTTLAQSEDLDRWVLDQSAFPGRTLWKIRMPISGKGYAPRTIFLSTNEASYELLGHSWVYRTMNAR